MSDIKFTLEEGSVSVSLGENKSSSDPITNVAYIEADELLKLDFQKMCDGGYDSLSPVEMEAIIIAFASTMAMYLCELFPIRNKSSIAIDAAMGYAPSEGCYNKYYKFAKEPIPMIKMILFGENINIKKSLIEAYTKHILSQVMSHGLEGNAAIVIQVRNYLYNILQVK